MFLRSCLSAFRKNVRNSRPIVSRTVFTNNRRALWAEVETRQDDSTSGTEEPDQRKRVTIGLQNLDGNITRIVGFVNESVYAAVLRYRKRTYELMEFGSCDVVTCGSCHVIMHEKDFDKPPEPASDGEQELIERLPGNCDCSRLGCQVILTEEMDGMVMKLPSPPPPPPPPPKDEKMKKEGNEDKKDDNEDKKR